MKKTIAILLLLCILVAAFASCGDEKVDTTQTNDSTEDNNLLDSLPKVDMNEFELGILTYDNEWFDWAEVAMAVDDPDSNVVTQAIFQRNSFIEEHFNCLLNITTETNIDKTYIENITLSGDTSSGVNIIMYYDKWVVASANCFRNWHEVDHIDLSQEYWNPGITQMFNVNNYQIAASGVFSLGMLSRTETVLYNKDMYASYYSTSDEYYASIYDYVFNDEWTLEKLYELGEGVLSSSDDVWDTKDQYGLSASKKELYTSLMIGSGIRFVQQDENGMPKFTLPSDTSAVDKLQKLLELNQDNQIHYDTSKDPHYANPELFFESGNTLFGVRVLYDIPTARGLMRSDFGILPIPKYDSAQKEYYSACFGGDVACLLKTVADEDLDYIGIIMEAMALHSQSYLIPKYKEDLLKTRYAVDPDSSRMLDIIFSTTFSEMGVTVLEDTVSIYLIKQVYVTEQDTISSELKLMQWSIPGELESLFQNIK